MRGILLLLAAGMGCTVSPLTGEQFEVEALPRIGGRQTHTRYYAVDLDRREVRRLESKPAGIEFASHHREGWPKLFGGLVQADSPGQEAIPERWLPSWSLHLKDQTVRMEVFLRKDGAWDGRTAGYSRKSGALLWRDERGRAASMAWQGMPLWVGEGDDDACFLKFRGWLLRLDAASGATPWMRETSGTAPCFLREKELIDVRSVVEYSPDFQRKSTSMTVRSLDPATGQVRANIPLRRFEGMYDEVFFGTALRGDVLCLELTFVTHD